MLQNVIVRPYRPDDKEAFGHVRSMTFRGGQPVLESEILLREDCRGFVGESERGIIAAFTALDMTCTINGGDLPCAGLAAVAVHPEARKSGVGSQLMTDGLNLLKQQGYALASLYAFRETYYRKFGYEVCGKRMLITCPESRMPDVRPQLDVREVPYKHWRTLIPAYEEFARKFNGMSIRKDEQWWRTLGGDTPFSLYVAGDPIEAYAMIRLSNDFWQDQPVKEFVWTSQRGYEAILSLLAGIGINKASVSWFEPGDGPFLASHLDQGVTLGLNRPIMYRILDLRACLTALKPLGEGEFTMRIEDLQMKEHAGPWRVTFKPGEVQVEKAETAELELTIQQLVQCILGEPGFGSLVRNGGLVADPILLHEVEKLFSARPVYCMDFF